MGTSSVLRGEEQSSRKAEYVCVKERERASDIFDAAGEQQEDGVWCAYVRV